MVDYKSDRLDRTFAAMADPTRRALLARLEGQDIVTISDLAKPFAMSLPAVMKHLDVLSDAGLVTRTKTGRTVFCRLNAAPMQEAVGWLERYSRFWNQQLDRLTTFLEEETPCPPNPILPTGQAPDPASPSNVASMRRLPKSTPRGRTPKK
jgi:DNA-binding transcriptional ArsR family regulator